MIEVFPAEDYKNYIGVPCSDLLAACEKYRNDLLSASADSRAELIEKLQLICQQLEDVGYDCSYTIRAIKSVS
jgi:hypothetical protein